MIPIALRRGNYSVLDLLESACPVESHICQDCDVQRRCEMRFVGPPDGETEQALSPSETRADGVVVPLAECNTIATVAGSSDLS